MNQKSRPACIEFQVCQRRICETYIVLEKSLFFCIYGATLFSCYGRSSIFPMRFWSTWGHNHTYLCIGVSTVINHVMLGFYLELLCQTPQNKYFPWTNSFNAHKHYIHNVIIFTFIHFWMKPYWCTKSRHTNPFRNMNESRLNDWY